MNGVETEYRTTVKPSHDGNGKDVAGAGQHQEHGEGEIPKDLPKPGNLTVIIVVCIFAALLVGLFFVGWIPYEHAKSEAAADATENSSTVPIVRVARPKPSVSARDLSFPCDVRANQSTDIYPRSNGYLKKLHVDIQDHVEENQLLAEIDAPDVEAQLAQSKANLAQSQANVIKAKSDLDLAQKTLTRYQETQKTSPGSVSQQEVDQNESAVEDAQSALAQANATVVAGQANVQQLTVLTGYEKVYAPFSGTITARNYDNGALLSPANSAGKQLFSIAQTDPLRVFITVPQSDATEIKKDQPAYLTVRNYPGREFTGTVARTAGSLDQTTRTLLVEIHFPNKDGTLLVGMYGQVRLEIRGANPSMIVPSSALVFNADGLRVATVAGDKVHFKKVQVGRDLGTDLEIATGVDANDQVVTNPGERLSEGSEVKIAQPQEAQASAAK